MKHHTSIAVQDCPLCRKSNSTLFDQRSFRGVLISNRLCQACGFIFQSPRMLEEGLAEFYAEEYRQVYQGAQGPDAKDLAVQYGRAEALLAFAEPFLRQPHSAAELRHLDIGSSSGLLLQRFQQAIGSKPVGIEPGDAYRQYAQAQGLTVYPDLTELSSNQKGRFHIISLAHVIEHLPDPLRYLSEIKDNWLEPQGWLLIETPNLYGHDCFEIAHLTAFSPHTLNQLLAQAGYQTVAQRIHGQPRSEILPLYITVLVKPAPERSGGQPPTIHPESSVRYKRKLAMLRRRLLTRISPRKAWLPTA